MPLGRIARFRATAQLLMGTTALQYSTDQEREHEFPRSFTALWIPCNERSNVVGSEMSPGVRKMDTASAESEPCAVQFYALGRNGGRNSDFYSARLRWKRPQRWKRDRWVMLMSGSVHHRARRIGCMTVEKDAQQYRNSARHFHLPIYCTLSFSLARSAALSRCQFPVEMSM